MLPYKSRRRILDVRLAQACATATERDDLLAELAWTQQALADTQHQITELRAVVLARQDADRELAGLYSQRSIERAMARPRDPEQAVH
jgi:hypothetical protein